MGKGTRKMERTNVKDVFLGGRRNACVLLVTLSMVLRRRRSAGRRQTSARQPSLRQSKALAEAPLTTRHETTVITICGDEVTVHTASNIGADVWGESGTTSVQ